MSPMTTKAPQILAPSVRPEVSSVTDQDVYLFNEGTHYRMYEKLGAHLAGAGHDAGVSFAVWAPNAREVSVIGGFNDWKPGVHALAGAGSSGIWEAFIPGIGKGTLYKFHIVSTSSWVRRGQGRSLWRVP